MNIPIDDTDSDTDGVPDVYDACPNSGCGEPVDQTGCPVIVFGDSDGDFDVDWDDYGSFYACLSGPYISQPERNCRFFDFD